MEQCKGKGEVDLKKGPWTVDEDLLLMNYVSVHGEGRWDSVARCAGLRRTGKSCRLRWLNYLRPDVRRGNITPEEQLLILQLHSRWGSRWSKIAQHLPGRTDNEIKNYWRTRVQKHAKQLRCDVNSKQFRDMVEYIWVPRLLERIQGGEAAAVTAGAESPNTGASSLECCSSSEVVQPSSSASGAAQEGEEVGLGDWLVDQETAAEFSDSLMESLRSPGVCDGSWLQDMDQLGGAWEESLWSIEDLWLQQGL